MNHKPFEQVVPTSTCPSKPSNNFISTGQTWSQHTPSPIWMCLPALSSARGASPYPWTLLPLLLSCSIPSFHPPCHRHGLLEATATKPFSDPTVGTVRGPELPTVALHQRVAHLRHHLNAARILELRRIRLARAFSRRVHEILGWLVKRKEWGRNLSKFLGDVMVHKPKMVMESPGRPAWDFAHEEPLLPCSQRTPGCSLAY